MLFKLGMFAFVWLLSSSLTLAQLPASVKICWEDGLKPPYLMLDEGQRPTGIAVDLLDRLLRSQKIMPEHLLMPWKRCLYDVESGAVDLVPNSTFQSARTTFALYTEPLYVTHWILVYNAEVFPKQPQVKTLEEMGRYTIGGILGFNYDAYQGKIHVLAEAPDREALLQQVIRRRVELAIDQKEVFLMLVKQGKIDAASLRFIPDPIVKEKAYHVLISKKHPQAEVLQQVLNAGIQNALQQGHLATLEQHYLGLPNP